MSIAATLLILFTSGLGGGSGPRDALAAADAPRDSHAIAATRAAPAPGEMGLPDPELPTTWEDPDTGVGRQAPLTQLALEVMCVLAVMLLLCVVLFLGEGLVWHGLVVTLGLTLLGFVLIRTPWGG